jgi:hypothetical protein
MCNRDVEPTGRLVRLRRTLNNNNFHASRNIVLLNVLFYDRSVKLIHIFNLSAGDYPYMSPWRHCYKKQRMYIIVEVIYELIKCIMLQF